MRPATAWRLPCPHCAAYAGDPCHTDGGRALAAGDTHRARWSAWARAQQEAAAGAARSNLLVTRQQQRNGLIALARLRDELERQHEDNEARRRR